MRTKRNNINIKACFRDTVFSRLLNRMTMIKYKAFGSSERHPLLVGRGYSVQENFCHTKPRSRKPTFLNLLFRQWNGPNEPILTLSLPLSQSGVWTTCVAFGNDYQASIFNHFFSFGMLCSCLAKKNRVEFLIRQLDILPWRMFFFVSGKISVLFL